MGEQRGAGNEEAAMEDMAEMPPAAGALAGVGGMDDEDTQAGEIHCPHLLRIIEQWPLVPKMACPILCDLVCAFADAA